MTVVEFDPGPREYVPLGYRLALWGAITGFFVGLIIGIVLDRQDAGGYDFNAPVYAVEGLILGLGGGLILWLAIVLRRRGRSGMSHERDPASVREGYVEDKMEAGAGHSGPTYLRVFEIARASETDSGTRFLEVELPTQWAQSHGHVEVALRKDEHFGWKAALVGDNNKHLLGFAWYDHVDQMLVEPDGKLPPDLTSGSWSDMEQGWWGSIIVDADDIYLGETDFDGLLDAAEPTDLVLVRPGLVAVAGVDVLWNRVPRATYEAAWDEAINRFRVTSG